MTKNNSKMKIEVTIDEFIGRKVKELRKKGKVTQDVLARYMGISHMGLSHFETGSRAWRLSHLIAVAKYFDKPLDYFVK